MSKFVRKPVRALLRVVALSALWINRRDVVRWAGFAKRAASRSTRPTAQDLMLEGRVRASLSRDPVLRADPSIRDLRVHDGVVVLEAPALWHNEGLAVSRLSQVDGVESVHTASDVATTNAAGHRS